MKTKIKSELQYLRLQQLSRKIRRKKIVGFLSLNYGTAICK